MKLRFSEIEHAIRTVENAALQAKCDQHLEAAVGFQAAAKILRSVALEIEEPEPKKP